MPSQKTPGNPKAVDGSGPTTASGPGIRAVVLDTNALLLPFTDGTRLEEELERLVGSCQLVVPSSIIGELKQLAQNPSTLGRNAKSALRLAQRCRVESTKLPGDDGLLQVARALGAIVVTNDRAIQAEAARSGLQVVVAREKGRLTLRGAGSS
jgi:uncharacterized protein